MSMRTPLALALALLLGACTQPPPEAAPDEIGGPSTGVGAMPAVTGDEQRDMAALDRLKQEARALAKADGCSAAAQCRTAPLGAKPCGGPWEYLVYCSVTTDSSALYRHLDHVRQYEDSLNTRYGRASTCELVMAPPVVLEGNTCRAANR